MSTGTKRSGAELAEYLSRTNAHLDDLLKRLYRVRERLDVLQEQAEELLVQIRTVQDGRATHPKCD